MPRSRSSVEHSGGKPKDQNTSKAVNDQRAQQTISELFATSKHKYICQDADDSVEISPSKRLKLGHPHSASKSTVPPPRPIGKEEMYSSFPSTKARNSAVIEISDDDSPPKPSSVYTKPSGMVRPKNITPQAGLKKLVVKNLRKTSRANPDQYYDHVWGQLDTALSSIFTNEKVPYSMEELYRGVEVVCRQDRASLLYRKLCDKCKHASACMVKPIIAIASEGNKDVDVLSIVVEAWSRWITQMVNYATLPSNHMLILLVYRAVDILLLGSLIPPSFSIVTFDRGHGGYRVSYTNLCERDTPGTNI